MAEAVVASRTTRRQPSEVLRNNSVEFIETVSTFKETFFTVVVRLYQSHIIDKRTKSFLFECSSPRVAANALLDRLELKIDANSRHLDAILQIMKEEESLEDLVENMEKEIVQSTDNAEELQEQPSTIGAIHMAEPAGDNDVDRAVVAANKLRTSFESLLTLLMTALTTLSSKINLNLLKLRISWHLSLTKQNPPPIQKVLQDLQEKATSPESVLNFLVINNLVGYLNFKLIDVINRDGILSENVKTELDRYESMHSEFYKMFTFNALIEAFKREPTLLPVSVIDLPNFRVELDQSWEGRIFYDWSEIINNIFNWPPHLIIIGFEKKCVILTCAILPHFVSTVVNDLTNDDFLKPFAAAGIHFVLPPYLLQLGRQENKAVDMVIERSFAIENILSPVKATPLVPSLDLLAAITSTSKPIPQPAPVPPEGGYDDEIFATPSPDDLQCIICLLTVREPHLITCCGAIICKICMARSNAKSDCPQCRDKDHLIVPDKRTNGRTMSLRVKCTSCTWTGKLIDYNQHNTEKCPDRIIQCQYGCGLYYKINDIIVHEEQDCTKRPSDVIIRYYEKRLVTMEEKYSDMIALEQRHQEEVITIAERHEEEVTATITERHEEEVTTITERHKEEVTTITERHEEEVITITERHEEEMTIMEARLLSLTMADTPTVKDNQPGIRGVPQWYNSPTAAHRINTPCVRTMTNFTKHKLNNESWYSPPFYTGPEGYKLQLTVDANGRFTFKGSHLSVGVHLMKGANDDYLGWPFKGSVDVKLLNWIEDENHLDHTFSTTSDSALNRVIDGDRTSTNGFQWDQLLSHDQLEYNNDYQTQYLMDDALCLVITRVQVFSGYESSIIPEWSCPVLFYSQYGVVPVYRTIQEFSQHKTNNDSIFTDPFYTSNGGFKLVLRVDPNGYGSGKGTHVSVGINLMRGPNDDNLQFPINGIFTVQILNWKEDNHHFEKSIAFDDNTPIECKQQVLTGDGANGLGKNEFISHNELLTNNSRYLDNDRMCLRISYEPLPPQTGIPVPSWCDAIYSNSATPPCTRTMYNYTSYKKTNSGWYSQPFYSSDKGYKLQLVVNANGNGSGKGTHLSVFVYLMKGEYDDTLSWPFNGTITVQLLNWSSDNHHVEKTIPHYTASLEYRDRVTEGTTAPGGLGYNFISHTALQDCTNNTIELINDNRICFRIIKVDI